MKADALFQCRDSLEGLNRDVPLSEKLDYLRAVVRERYPFIDRIAVATYDERTDLLTTFIHSSDSASPLQHYQARLSETESLRKTVEAGVPRVVNDLSIFDDVPREHARRMRAQHYGASYTMPMFSGGALLGFVFFNSCQSGVFTEEVRHYLDLFAHLLALTVSNELRSVETLSAAVRTTTALTHHRDSETGGHLERMARYARLIALTVAEARRLTDEFIEHLFMFAPLHDVGKIGIPDHILLKEARLTPEEFDIMKTHTLKGREIVDNLLNNFALRELPHGEMLRNIAEHHHEAMNGAGYPTGLRGEQIPIEARIVAVADVFDALTSQRPYKPAWDNDKAFGILDEMAGDRLDHECVEALKSQRAQVEEIQALFRDEVD